MNNVTNNVFDSVWWPLDGLEAVVPLKSAIWFVLYAVLLIGSIWKSCCLVEAKNLQINYY